MDIKEKIKQADDVRKTTVHVDEWDVDIEVRTMNLTSRIEFLSSVRKGDEDVDKDKFYPLLVIATAHDPESGDKLFTLDDLEWIKQKNGQAMEQVALAAMDVNGMSVEVETELGKD